VNTQLLEQPELTELDKIRQQFDHSPYPRISLDQSPQNNHQTLFFHSLVTPYYLKYRQVVSTEGKLILDAGCGSGYNSLILSMANPGAKVVGIDLSAASVQLARDRLKHHGIANAEFHVLSIQDLPQLGLEFDYINCDEVLYLFPDPAAALQTLKSVLKPEGMIRSNLHSIYQRQHLYRAQTLFKFLGLMDESPKEVEHGAVVETMNALKNSIRLKAECWGDRYQNPEQQDEMIAMNLLFVGDQGFTIPDLFKMLDRSDLEFISMVDWRHWEVSDLFEEPDDLPSLWAMSLAYASAEEKLHLYELLHPVHRLLDFWCGHSGREKGVPVDEWQTADWEHAKVHLHPRLCNQSIKNDLVTCINTRQPFEISRYLPKTSLAPVTLDSVMAGCLLPLWENSLPIQALVDRYHQIHPVHPVTLQPIDRSTVFEEVKQCLNKLDAFLYILLER
jgi:2-polyprenyl-3-methyl-5-hydroxy-6-metoxy-1,4-benzoquinol methylase